MTDSTSTTSSSSTSTPSSSNILKEIKEYFECPVCLTIPRKPPIFQCENGHMICAGCKPQMRACPQCRKRFSGRLLFAERMLELVPVTCRYQNEGCDLELMCQYIDGHEKSCLFGPILCTYQVYGCTRVMSRRELSKHLESCESMPIDCQVEGCDKKIAKNQYLRHIKTEHVSNFDLSLTNSIFILVLLISIIINFSLMDW